MRSRNKATKLNWESKFSKKTKEEKKNCEKMTKVWPSKVYFVGMGAITSGKIRNYKEKTKGVFEIAKLKKEASSGEEISGPQPLNYFLASFRHRRGRNNTDPRPANACTTLFFY